jgi:hypothetical protein
LEVGGASSLVLLDKYNQNDHVKEGEMGWVCSMHGDEEEYI